MSQVEGSTRSKAPPPANQDLEEVEELKKEELKHNTLANNELRIRASL
jgi:hypothetical protein